jgi:cytoskeletal protein RodZ
MRYLTAIESDDYKRLPGGIFNRSFIRAYARHIGYDEDAAVSEYASMVRDQSDSPDDPATKPYKSRVYEGPHSNRSPMWTLLLAILILAALSLTVWAGLHFYQRRTAPRTQPGSTNRGRLPENMTKAGKDKLIAIREATISWKGDARGEQNGFNV